MSTKPPTAEEAYREWLPDDEYDPGWRAQSAFKAGFAAGRREGYAEALKDVEKLIDYADEWERTDDWGDSYGWGDFRRNVRALESEEK